MTQHTTTLPTMWLAAILIWALAATLFWVNQWWLYRRTYYGVQVHPEQPVVWDTRPHSSTPARPAPEDARAAG